VSANAVELRGFEEALCAWLVENFKFSGVDLASIPLAVGRTFFANFMPEADAVAASNAGAALPFDSKKEPAICFYTSSSPGVRASASRWVKYEANLLMHLRVVGSQERAKKLLEEVFQFLLRRVKGKRVGTFQVKAALPQQRPTSFQRQADDRAYSQANVRFFYVALNA
jgi:hypothetical protein